MSGVLQKYGVDPKDLSQEQLYKLALILQLLKAQEKTGTVPQASNKETREWEKNIY